MPISVTIKVNENTVKTLHIARISGGLDRNPDKEHTYSVLQQAKEPQSDYEWTTGTEFLHKYGDDITVCVAKAIAALNE